MVVPVLVTGKVSLVEDPPKVKQWLQVPTYLSTGEAPGNVGVTWVEPSGATTTLTFSRTKS